MNCVNIVRSYTDVFSSVFSDHIRYGQRLIILVKMILEVVFTTEPSLVHENVGAGLPTALQVKFTISPSVFALFFGWVLNSG